MRKLGIVAGIVVSFAAGMGIIAWSARAQTPMHPECAPAAPGDPMLVTADCVDAHLKDPYTDIDEMRSTPVPHRYVHGGFKGTDAKF